MLERYLKNKEPFLEKEICVEVEALSQDTNVPSDNFAMSSIYASFMLKNVN